MNTKKIWLLAMVFGIIAAGMMYLMIIDKQNQPEIQESHLIIEENLEEIVEVETEVEEEVVSKLIPVSVGKRAITIAVADVQGIAGFVNAGSYVDVIAVMEVAEEQKESQHDSATLLLQNVKVLAVGHAADDEETMGRYQMVTVEVTPKEGLTLSFSSRYELYLMLRQDGDEKLEPDHPHIHEDELHEGVFK